MKNNNNSDTIWFNYLFYFIFTLLIGNVSGIVNVNRIFFIAILGNCGTYSLMTIYVTTAVASLFLAKKLVDWLGATISLVVSCATYVISAGAFALSIYDSSSMWYVMIPASVLAGIGDAMWYTGLGVLMSEFSYLTSISRDTEKLNEARSSLSSVASILDFLLGGLYQVGSSVILYSYSELFLFASAAMLMVVFTLLALAVNYGHTMFILHQHANSAGSIVVTSYSDGDKEIDGYESDSLIIKEELMSTCELEARGSNYSTFQFIYNQKMMRMFPFLLLYCLTYSMVNVYINAEVIVDSSSLVIDDIGWLSAVSRVAGILANPVLAYLVLWRHEVVIVCCFLCFLGGLMTYSVSENTLGTEAYLIPFLIVFGFIRAVYSNTLSVVFVEFFEFDVSGAFSYRSFLVSVLFSFVYWIYTYVSVTVISWSIMVSSVVAGYSYWQAYLMHNGREIVQQVVV